MVKSLRQRVFEAQKEGRTNKQIFSEFKDYNKDTVKKYIYQSKEPKKETGVDEGWKEIEKVLDERNSYLRELVELCYFNYHLEQYLGKDKWKTIVNEVKEHIINLTDDIDYKTPYDEESEDNG